MLSGGLGGGLGALLSTIIIPVMRAESVRRSVWPDTSCLGWPQERDSLYYIVEEKIVSQIWICEREDDIQ